MVVRRNTSIFFHLPLNFLEFFFLVDRTHSQIGQLLSKPSLFRQSIVCFLWTCAPTEDQKEGEMIFEIHFREIEGGGNVTVWKDSVWTDNERWFPCSKITSRYIPILVTCTIQLSNRCWVNHALFDFPVLLYLGTSYFHDLCRRFVCLFFTLTSFLAVPRVSRKYGDSVFSRKARSLTLLPC